ALDVGGGGANAAVGLSRLGLKTAFFGKIGQDLLGKLVKGRLREEKVGQDLLEISPDSSISIVLLSNTGEKTLIMYRGDHDQLELSSELEQKLKKTKWIYLADLRGKVFTLINQVVALAKENGIKVFFVPGVGELEWGLNKLVKISNNSEIVIMNKAELGGLLQEDINELDMTQDFTNIFGCKIVVITQDIEGSFAYNGFKVFHEPAKRVKAVDATGAGDAYASGFLAEFIRTGEISAAMEMGTRNAAAVIAKIGAQKGLLRKG
ncbi:carbohydrate kinase family protein, partial [Patescibacteria group bacterium]|nr:carbohydrate kinase family protein [Patescibacteria group bacterium]